VVRADGGGRGAVGFLSRILGGGDSAEAPPPEGDPARIAQVEAVLADVRPLLAADGGDVRLVEVTDEGLVRLKLVGACEHCFQSPVTTEAVLSPRLRDALEWVRDVVVR
jgi:Fe-S cluster biogenesis protein NfuA